jgi:hypothetical protein
MKRTTKKEITLSEEVYANLKMELEIFLTDKGVKTNFCEVSATNEGVVFTGSFKWKNCDVDIFYPNNIFVIDDEGIINDEKYIEFIDEVYDPALEELRQAMEGDF